ncbi:RagB/SusD family nutrient uptake outer membrane protein [termite gut metagenome]|uniref:RagB/SusD family nutrient uptake outer membrane protein n=1 Tax=termite gut metagenome TaxID=433724 RepID=A0A5J4QHQ5_9ZZZZ
MLLMYAEACNESGDDSEAQDALKKVRNRVGLGDVTSTGNDLRKAIRNERRLELAFEQNRLYDIRRWTDDNGKKMICNLMGPTGSFVRYNTNETTADRYEWANQGEASDKGISFDENRDLIFPIPLYEITMSNGSITQNSGWH